MRRKDDRGIWMTSAQACRELGICYHTLAKLVNDGYIGTLQVPGLTTRTYRRTDVEALARAGERPATVRVDVESAVN